MNYRRIFPDEVKDTIESGSDRLMRKLLNEVENALEDIDRQIEFRQSPSEDWLTRVKVARRYLREHRAALRDALDAPEEEPHAAFVDYIEENYPEIANEAWDEVLA